MFGKPLDIDDINDNEMKKVWKKIHNDFLQITEKYEGCRESFANLGLDDEEISQKIFEAIPSIDRLEYRLKVLILRLHLLLCLTDNDMIVYNSNNFSINFLLMAQIFLLIIFSFLPLIPITIHFGFESFYCYLYRKWFGYPCKVNEKLFIMELISKKNSKRVICQKIKWKMKKGSHRKRNPCGTK